MSCLLVDVGNTRVKYAVTRGSRVGRVSFLPTGDCTVRRVREISREAAHDYAVICSGVEKLTALFDRAVGGPVHFVGHRSELGFSLKGYRKPGTIGADRLANACGAAALFGTPVIAVDLGTALTVDLVDGQGIFRGGVIAPGLRSFAESLAARAPALPRVEPSLGRLSMRAIGRSTKEAMLSGTANGFTGAVREIIESVLREFAEAAPSSRSSKKTKQRQPAVVATGGDAELMAKRLDCFDSVCKNLTLEGLRRIAELNSKP